MSVLRKAKDAQTPLPVAAAAATQWDVRTMEVAKEQAAAIAAAAKGAQADRLTTLTRPAFQQVRAC